MHSRRSSVASFTSLKSFNTLKRATLKLTTSVRESIRDSVCSSTPSPRSPHSPSSLADFLPPGLVNLHREIYTWSRTAQQQNTYVGKSWVVPSGLDGHEFAFTMNLSLNGRGVFWQVVYSIALNSVFVRLLRSDEAHYQKRIIPEVKVVGRVQHIV